MAGALDFLFQGSAPVVQPSGGDVSTGGPLWLQQSVFNLNNAANNLAQQPYQQFPGPQVAQQSGATQQAQQMAQGNVGNYNPYLQQAGALTKQAGAAITPGDISTFMNPYQDYVTGALNKNLQQNILPGVQDKFVSAGQSRSPQEAQLTSQAIYGTQQAAGQALAGGYQGALNSMLQQRQQQGQAGAQFGQLGALTQSFGANDVGALAASGQQQDQYAQANINAALNNWQQQQQYPYQQLGFLSNIERGLPTAGTGSNTQSTYATQGVQGASPLAKIGGVLSGASGLGFRKGGLVPSRRGALSDMRLAA
jgi:hypothetical protein